MKKYSILKFSTVVLFCLSAFLSFAEINADFYMNSFSSDDEAITSLLTELAVHRKSITDNQALWRQWGYIWLEVNRGHITEAQDKLNRLKDGYAKNPELTTALYWLANAYWDTGRNSQAAELYQEIINNVGDCNEAYHCAANLTVLHIRQKDFTKAQTALQQLRNKLSRSAKLADSLLWVAKEYRLSGKMDLAEPIYEEIITDYPTSDNAVWAGYRLIEDNIKTGRYDLADIKTAELLNSKSDNPNKPTVVYWLGNAYWDAGKYENAIEMYNKVITAWPNSETAFDATKNSAIVNIKAGNTADAQAAYHQLVNNYRWDKDIAFSCITIANQYLNNGYLDQAKAAYDDILLRWPNNYYAMFAERSLLAIDIKKNNFDIVEGRLPGFLSKYAGHKEMNKALFWLVEEYYNEAVKKTDQQQVKRLLGKALELGQFREKKFAGVKCSYSDPPFYACLGDIYNRLDNPAKALECYQKVVTEYPDYKLAWHIQFLIGRCYDKMAGENLISQKDADSKIRKAYEKIISDYPNCKAASAAKEWLSRNN